MEEYDLIIVGAGPAGLTAGIYGARSGLKTAIISKEIGGTANSILLLENWPGFSGTGVELMKKFYDSVKKYDVDFITGEVKSLEKKGKNFIIKMENKEFESKALIIATGSKRKQLKIPGEKELEGRGVSYCITCDAFFFKNKTVAVIGGSDCASGSALALAKVAKKVYVIYRGEHLRCEEIILENLEKNNKIEIIYDAIPKEIKGKDNVESLVIKERGKERELKLDGIFVEIGSVPITEFSKNLKLKLDKENNIIVNENMETSVKGVFAAGDVTNSKVKQVLTSSAEGAIAAKNAGEYLKKSI